MGQTAVTIGKAINYQNAGTVEFILDEKGNY
jgi:acetyl/propionyl-CoA carboxylase alpha subunit